MQDRTEVESEIVEEPTGKLESWNDIFQKMERNLSTRKYSPRTIQAYLDWGRKFAFRHREIPKDGEEASNAVQGYLEYLALSRNLSRASIDQARNALAWLVKKEFGFEMVLGEKGDAHHGRRLPSILAPQTVKEILDMAPEPWDLFFGLQYGCGMRLAELLELRVQDIDLRRGTVVVRSGKGDKDRLIPFPKSLQARLERHLQERQKLWLEDKARGLARVDLPGSLAAKYPHADTSWAWQHMFGSARPLRHPETGELRRWHPMESLVRDALRNAATAAGVTGRVHPHLLRHCYATHLLESGVPLPEIRELMGHARLETTMIYLHVRSPVASRFSPLDRLAPLGS